MQTGASMIFGPLFLLYPRRLRGLLQLVDSLPQGLREAFRLVGRRAACNQAGADLAVGDSTEILQQPLDVGSGDASKHVFAVFTFEPPL